MKNAKVQDNVTSGHEYWVQCENCQNETKHNCRKSSDVTDQSPDGDIHLNYAYQIIECCGCGQISFRQSSTSSEDTMFNDDGEEKLVEHVELYPRRIKGKPLEHEYYLPEAVRRIYSEVLSALRNAQPILAGVGIRALIEAVCAEKGTKARSLVEKIDELATSQVLTADGAKILHSVRLLGNKAAHEVAVPSDEHLKAALQVAENLLVNVYILQRVADKLQP